MKKITKVLMAAVAVSTLCFAGCKMPDEVIGGDIFDDWNTEKNDDTGAEITATIDNNNPSEVDIERGILLFKNKKKDIAVNVVMEDPENVPGFMSVVFNQTKNKNGTYNFIALGFNSDDYPGNKAKIACTYYKNVKKEDLKAKNFGKTDTDKSSLDDDIQELMPSADNEGFVPANIAPDVDGKLKVGFVITANEGDTPYEVRVYENKTAKDLNAIADAIASKTIDDDGVIAGSVKEFSIKNSDLGRTDTKKIEAGIGFYANVYKGKTLKGEWQVGDISHNPNGIIWEDEIPNTLNIQLAE